MKNITDDPQVRRYLGELDSRLSGLPDTERQEILRDVQEHIQAERQTGSNIPAVLKELGSPSEVASAANQNDGKRHDDSPLYLIITTCLLLVGGFTLIGWFIGVALLWASKSRTLLNKVVCSFVWPGGLAGALIFFFIPTRSEGHFYPGGYTGDTGNEPWAVVAAVALFLVPAIVQIAFLLRTLADVKKRD